MYDVDFVHHWGGGPDDPRRDDTYARTHLTLQDHKALFAQRTLAGFPTPWGLAASAYVGGGWETAREELQRIRDKYGAWLRGGFNVRYLEAMLERCQLPSV